MNATPAARVALRALALAGALTALAAPLAAQLAPFRSVEGLSVSTAERSEVSRMTDGGVVSVEGAGAFVITIAGELRGRADREGVIGVILVPELPFFSDLNRNRRIVLSAADYTATIKSGHSGYFLSPSKRLVAGFPSYHLFLFNTTGAAATVNVYVNPTRS